MDDRSTLAPSTPAPNAPRIPGPPASPPPDIEIDALTPTQAASMITWTQQDRAAGKLTQDQANKMFEELGATPEQRAPDLRTDEQKQLDAAYPQAKTTDYTIRYGKPGAEMEMTPEIRPFDTAARTLLSEGGLPRENGNALAHMIDEVAVKTASMNAAQFASYQQTERAILVARYGGDAQAKVDAADAMLADLAQRQPGGKAVLERLKTAGVFHSARVQAMLMDYAPIYWAKRGR